MCRDTVTTLQTSPAWVKSSGTKNKCGQLNLLRKAIFAGLGKNWPEKRNPEWEANVKQRFSQISRLLKFSQRKFQQSTTERKLKPSLKGRNKETREHWEKNSRKTVRWTQQRMEKTGCCKHTCCLSPGAPLAASTTKPSPKHCHFSPSAHRRMATGFVFHSQRWELHRLCWKQPCQKAHGNTLN